MKYSKLLSALLFSVCLSGTAFAGPLDPDSELSYVAFLTPMASDETTAVDLSVADFLDFNSGAGTGLGTVIGAQGDFAPLLFTQLNLNNFHIDPFGGAGPTPPPVTIWSGSGFTFSLDTLSILDQNPSSLSLRGYGHVSGNGFDTTSGIWTLSANTSAGVNFVFSAQTALPEPNPVALFGLVLLAVGVVSRRKRLV